jgi:hypothetical protein
MGHNSTIYSVAGGLPHTYAGGENLSALTGRADLVVRSAVAIERNPR